MTKRRTAPEGAKTPTRKKARATRKVSNSPPSLGAATEKEAIIVSAKVSALPALREAPSAPVEVKPEASSAAIEPIAEAAAESTAPPVSSSDEVPAMPALAEANEAGAGEDVSVTFKDTSQDVPPVEDPSAATASIAPDSAPVIETMIAEYEKLAASTPAAFLPLAPSRIPAIKEARSLVKQNLETVMHSSSAATRQFESLGREVAEFGWRQLEGMFAAWAALLQTKSPIDRLQVQCDYACAALKSVVGQGSRTAIAVIDLADEMKAPIARQYSGAFYQSVR
jgi:hypothetical protein